MNVGPRGPACVIMLQCMLLEAGAHGLQGRAAIQALAGSDSWLPRGVCMELCSRVFGGVLACPGMLVCCCSHGPPRTTPTVLSRIAHQLRQHLLNQTCLAGGPKHFHRDLGSYLVGRAKEAHCQFFT